MRDKNISNTPSQDSEFQMVFGWLAATAVSIACWAGLS